MKNNSHADSAAAYIINLKQGALVVRLKTKSKAINALINQQRNAEAEQIASAQKEENLRIRYAFDSLYNFSKTYFIYADSTDVLQRGMRKGFFLNKKLEVEDSIEMREKFFLIAEKGTPIYETKYDPTNVNQQAIESGGLTETLIVLDKNLNQLKDPFPYYSKDSFLNNFSAVDWKSKVKNLNNRFHSFYKKSL